MLDRAVATFPLSTSWWIKGDAVDLVEGLCESERGEWSGNIDLSDGQLQQMFQQYKGRLQFIKMKEETTASFSQMYNRCNNYWKAIWSFWLKVCICRFM